MNINLVGALVLGLMVSFQASAAREKVEINLPKDAISSVSMTIKILQHGVVKHSYKGNVVRTLTLFNTAPNNSQPGIDWDNIPVLFSEHSTTRLELDIYTVSPPKTMVKIAFNDSNLLRRRSAGGEIENMPSGAFEFQAVVALVPGEEFKIPYSVCEDTISELCDRELSIMVN